MDYGGDLFPNRNKDITAIIAAFNIKGFLSGIKITRRAGEREECPLNIIFISFAIIFIFLNF